MHYIKKGGQGKLLDIGGESSGTGINFTDPGI